MLLPSLFTENLFDDWFDFPMDREMRNMDRRLYGKHADHVMKTDVREHEDHYEVDVDLPGFKKDEISLELNQGYLTLSARKGHDEDTKNKEGKVIRQERYTGSMQRSFYVGDQLTEEDIHARFESGVLHLELPKNVKRVPEKKTICIEG
ncbi:MAG: Hsp20/alpha crystallin family protein [Clostridia bacterium]|nr:Hsp20/alpha crystallin family protein [Clostridia bacterium]